MKLISLFLLSVFLHTADPVWQTDFAKAKIEARESDRFILLNFSGSDWCTPCIRMEKTIFETDAFKTYAGKELVLANADFPRLNKHQLSKEQQKQNDNLAEQYNPDGKFPYTLLISNEGKVVKTWEGCPNESPEDFIAEINTVIHGHK
jgi:thioredoxin-related protein